MKCQRTGSVAERELVAGLLDIVFADVRGAGGDRPPDGLRREGLGHSDQPHVGAAAAAGLRGGAQRARTRARRLATVSFMWV